MAHRFVSWDKFLKLESDLETCHLFIKSLTLVLIVLIILLLFVGEKNIAWTIFQHSKFLIAWSSLTCAVQFAFFASEIIWSFIYFIPTQKEVFPPRLIQTRSSPELTERSSEKIPKKSQSETNSMHRFYRDIFSTNNNNND